MREIIDYNANIKVCCVKEILIPIFMVIPPNISFTCYLIGSAVK
jgi:hypothetical protein